MTRTQARVSAWAAVLTLSAAVWLGAFYLTTHLLT